MRNQHNVKTLIEKYQELNKYCKGSEKEIDDVLFSIAQLYVCYQCEFFPDTCDNCGTKANGWQPKDVLEVQMAVPEIAGYWQRLRDRSYRAIESK
ncbi:MAG: hypothetical protein KJ697_00535 [Nanoarchaeota archaeon]|nr:hypothetical protein [Nanoarchaeota archaeon]MBU4124134.1 hypothetical protein [Nanoarchaeota archaeon]